MCSGSEAGSYSRLIDLVYHSALGWREMKKKKKKLAIEKATTRVDNAHLLHASFQTIRGDNETGRLSARQPLLLSIHQ